MRANIAGRIEEFTHHVELPAVDETYPELERLWALGRTRWLEYVIRLGVAPPDAEAEMLQVGLDYQIVTDKTSMLLLPESAFAEIGIDRANRDRTRTEEEARRLRDEGVSDAPSPASTGSSGSSSGGSSSGGSSGSSGGHGGGAVGPLEALTCLGLALLMFARRRRAHEL